MGKKDKKIEVKVEDASIVVNKQSYQGYQLILGKKIIGEIIELDNRFGLVDKEKIVSFYSHLDDAIQAIIANYNLNN